MSYHTLRLNDTRCRAICSFRWYIQIELWHNIGTCFSETKVDSTPPDWVNSYQTPVNIALSVTAWASCNLADGNGAFILRNVTPFYAALWIYSLLSGCLFLLAIINYVHWMHIAVFVYIRRFGVFLLTAHWHNEYSPIDLHVDYRRVGEGAVYVILTQVSHTIR